MNIPGCGTSRGHGSETSNVAQNYPARQQSGMSHNISIKELSSIREEQDTNVALGEFKLACEKV